MSDPDTLHVFLHIPKCAGTSFSINVKYNLSKEEILFISPGPEEGFDTKEDVDRFIGALGTKRRDKVRLVLGHSVYYGIHEHFGRPTKYFTFLRSPVDQAISWYNFILKNYASIVASDEDKILPRDARDFTFSKRCQVFDPNVQLSTVLNYLIDGRNGTWGTTRLGEDHLEQAKRVLDRFFFVGLAEDFDEESAFLYHELGFTKCIGYRANATPRPPAQKDSDFVRLVSDRVHLDQQLYDYAVQLNKAFKCEHEGYRAGVEDFEARATTILPLRVITSDTLRRLFGTGAVLWLWKLKSMLVK